MLKKILREPLLQFLVLGGAIFVVYSFWGNRDAALDVRPIVVDEAALINFMQNRTRIFEPEAQRTRLEAMSPTEVDALINDYVREEVLYREAKTLGLGEDDYIIKQRLVQKMEFIANAAVEQVAPLSIEDVAAYFEAHRGDYAVPSLIYFTHIFFDAELHGRDAALKQAKAALKTIEQGGDLPDGDRFPFSRSYVDRSRNLVANHFGDAAAEEFWSIEPGEAWHGPIESPYGFHLVRVYERTEGRTPELEEIDGRVAADAAAAKANEAVESATRDIMKQYDVRIEYKK